MKKPLTKIAFEQYLNNQFAEMDEEQLFDRFIYLTTKSRGAHCSEVHLRGKIIQGKIGSLLRKLDSVAFECAYNDEKRRNN